MYFQLPDLYYNSYDIGSWGRKILRVDTSNHSRLTMILCILRTVEPDGVCVLYRHGESNASRRLTGLHKSTGKYPSLQWVTRARKGGLHNGIILKRLAYIWFEMGVVGNVTLALKLYTTSVPTNSVMLGGKKVRFPPGPTSIVVWRSPPIGLVPGTVLVEVNLAAASKASKVLPVIGL
jgi:hypothetical protein